MDEWDEEIIETILHKAHRFGGEKAFVYVYFTLLHLQGQKICPLARKEGLRPSLLATLEDHREETFSNLQEALTRASQFVESYQIPCKEIPWAKVLQKLSRDKSLPLHYLRLCGEKDSYRALVLLFFSVLLFDPERDTVNFQRLNWADSYIHSVLEKNPGKDTSAYLSQVREAIPWAYNLLWKHEGLWNMNTYLGSLPPLPPVAPSERDRTEAGILFAAFRDPLCVLYRAVTKQEYSSVGFYHTTTAGGRRRTRVILLDCLGNKVPWVSDRTTVESLSRDPRVLRLGKRELLSSKRREFLLSVGSLAILSHEEDNLRYLMLQMLGHPTENRNISALDILRNVSQAVGNCPSSSWSVSSRSLTEVAESSHREGKLDVLSQIAGQVTSPGPLSLSTYLSACSAFGPHVVFPLKEHSPVEIEEAERELLSLYAPRVIQMTTLFTQLLLQDREFLGAVKKALEPRKLQTSLLPDLIQEQRKLIVLLRETRKEEEKALYLQRLELLCQEMEIIREEGVTPEQILQGLTSDHLLSLLKIQH